MAVVECELHLDDEGGADRLPGMPLVGLFWGTLVSLPIWGVIIGLIWYAIVH